MAMKRQFGKGRNTSGQKKNLLKDFDFNATGATLKSKNKQKKTKTPNTFNFINNQLDLN